MKHDQQHAILCQVDTERWALLPSNAKVLLTFSLIFCIVWARLELLGNDFKLRNWVDEISGEKYHQGNKKN